MMETMEKYKKLILIGLGILLLVFAGAMVYFYRQFTDLKENPQKIAEKETRQIVERVGRLMVLPEEEMPTVATVIDPEKLKDQLFFVNAKTGDKVLIYTNAKKAILYDPVQNKIIEVTPLNIGNQ